MNKIESNIIKKSDVRLNHFFENACYRMEIKGIESTVL